jgi:broad specificity phosphatase PhoE
VWLPVPTNFKPGAVLTEVGRRQAALIGERLAQIPFATIYHSPWDRAAQTAQIIAGHHPGVPVRASDLLRECVPSPPPDERLTAQQAAWFADWSLAPRNQLTPPAG